MDNPSLDWERLQETFYRSRKLCEISPEVNAKFTPNSNLKYAASWSYIAIHDGQLLQVVNYLGEQLLGINTERFGEIVGFEFNENQELLLAVPYALYHITSFYPFQLHTIKLDETIQDSIWCLKRGLLITKTLQDIYEYTPANGLNILCKNNNRYTLLTKDHWDANQQFLTLLDLNNVYQVDRQHGRLQKSLRDVQWHRVTISPNGITCLYNIKSTNLQVYRDSSNILLEVTLNYTPLDIQWCGNDCIVCNDGTELRLYGPNGSYISYWYKQNILHSFTQNDGLKVLTADSLFLISKVASSTVDIFRIGSTEPAAILFDCMNLLETSISRTIENLHAIDLQRAVNTCIEAAVEETEPSLQKKLLNAAAFGKASLKEQRVVTQKFVDTCKMLKIMDSIRFFGFLITAEEYIVIGFGGIINAMLLQNKHYEALKLCELAERQDQISKIFTHWAITKLMLSSDIDDEQLLDIIKKQLISKQREANYISTTEIAHTAFLEGRFKLSRGLALLEKNPALKVLSLLEVDDMSLAIIEMLKTHSPEMIMSLLLDLETRLSTSDFARLLLLDMPDHQLYAYYHRNDNEVLFDFYRQTDQYFELAQLLVKQSEEQGHEDVYSSQVRELYSKVLDDASLKSSIEILKRQELLQEYQRKLTVKFQIPFEHLTLDQTLEKLISTEQEKQVNEFVKMFKVSTKKVYHITCRTLVKEHRYDKLYQLATSKRSPIGYMPFYTYLQNEGQLEQAARYIDMMGALSYTEKKRMYLECRKYREAIQLAGREGDTAALSSILKMIPDDQPQLQKFARETINAA